MKAVQLFQIFGQWSLEKLLHQKCTLYVNYQIWDIIILTNASRVTYQTDFVNYDIQYISVYGDHPHFFKF